MGIPTHAFTSRPIRTVELPAHDVVRRSPRGRGRAPRSTAVWASGRTADPLGPPTYKLLFSHASRNLWADLVSPLTFSSSVDASRHGEKVRKASGADATEYEIMRVMPDGPRSVFGETPEEVMIRRWGRDPDGDTGKEWWRW